jgi:hypothetical protein
MANIFEIPLLNPLRAIWQSDKLNADPSGTVLYQAFNSAYNYRNIDSDWYYRTLKEYEQKQPYVQPFQQSDTIRVQWIGSDNTSGYYDHVRLLDSNGSDTGVQISVGSMVVGSNTLYTITLPLWNINEGKYFLSVYHHPLSNEKTCIVFEPFYVKQVHIKTVRIDYYNSFNDQSVIYPTSAYIPQIRVHGCITDVTNESKFNVYEDQPMNVEMVSGIPYRTFELTLGGSKGIPQWYADIIERALLTDTLMIDGIAYTRAEGAKLESKKEAGKPLNMYTIKLRERYNTATLDIVQKKSYVVGAMPQTDYFWIETMTINNASVDVRRMFKGKRNFLDYLNATYLLTYGYWAEDYNNKLVFVLNSITTSINTTTLTTVNTLAYGIRFRCVGTGDFTIDLSAPASSNFYAVAYSDGSASINKTALAVFTSITTITKSFGFNNVKDVFIFGSNIKTYDTTSSTIKITEVDGDLAIGCTDLSMSSIISTNTIGNLFKYMTSLKRLLFNDLSLSSSMIDSIIMNLYDARTRLHSTCIIYLNGQTPSAPPSNTQGINLFKSTIKSLITTLTTD